MMSAKVDGLTVSATRRGSIQTKPVKTRPGSDAAFESGPKVILDNIEAILPGGQCSAIIGPNGAGKTTLLKALIGLLPIESGTLLWHDSNSVRSAICMK